MPDPGVIGKAESGRQTAQRQKWMWQLPEQKEADVWWRLSRAFASNKARIGSHKILKH
jgi:hypothetical protein